MLEDIVKKVKAGTGSVLGALEGDKGACGPGGETTEELAALDHATLKRRLKDFALEKVVDKVDQFNDALPIFESVGFLLRRIDIEVGLSPAVMARFDIITSCSEAEAQEALKRLVSDPTLQSVLNSMLKAVRLHRVLHIGTLELVGVAVTIGTMPSVRLIFDEGASSDSDP